MTLNVSVTRRGAERARRAGHLWIYRSDVSEAGKVAGGSIVRVLDDRGKFLGQAFYSDRSEIALRLLTLADETIDREWWRAKLRACAERRKGIEESTNAFRVVYSEGDLLPSLIVDKYSDVLVVQMLSQGTERLKETLVGLLIEEFEPRAIIERNDVHVREREGLEMRRGVLYGEAPAELEIMQSGVKFVVAPLGGQKTGAFLDQRENYTAAGRYAHGRALDCFTFNGGFALHIAGACESVVGLDTSTNALDAARRNAQLNNISNTEFREANVFDELRELETRGERFDTIVLDPPAFAKAKSSISAALRGYKEINLQALKMLAAGGVLITCTCSHHVREGMFLESIAEAANDAGKRVQILERRLQAGDHPVLLNVPETLYLKCVIAQTVE